MANTWLTRRHILGTAGAFVASASPTFRFNSAIAQPTPSGTGSKPQIDAALRHFVDAGEVPGVVAIAATDRGLIYEGAFGKRETSPKARI